ncbi:MAG TPA: Gfo/Idh/MocA family oxidoreductase [Ardenticatenaceae bacterium]
MAEPTTAIMIGAGNRGYYAYGPYALEHPTELRFVAVAEANPERRARFAAAHHIPPEHQFASWESLLANGQIADTCFIMTQDQHHYAPALAALDLGYDVLLEKPMSPHLEENVALVQAAERSGRLLQVCHVLRYAPFFATLHEILASGRLGEIVTVEHRENVVYWHMAHSYVRGNWRSAALSSPMILAKCCHDLDILQWNLGGRARRLHSFGSLIHFRPEQMPPGATLRCTDGCPAGPICPFDARRLYLDPQRLGQWPLLAISDEQTPEALRHALETGPYGRCVYRCDNDVVDHQTVNIEWDNGATVLLAMHGHAHEEGRTMRYDGTRATLRGSFLKSRTEIEIHDHLTGRTEMVPIPPAHTGHGGGDFGVVRAFLRAVRGHEPALTTAREALESHLLAFAAEASRLTGAVVNMDEFRRDAEASSLTV